MSAPFELNPPCRRFEHDPGQEDPADPDRRFCGCGWTEEGHASDPPAPVAARSEDPEEMIQAIREAHRLIAEGASDEALDALSWFLIQEQIDRHHKEEAPDPWPTEMGGNQ